MLRLLLCFFVFILFSTPSKSQKKLTFNDKGQLVKAPPKIRKKGTLTLKIANDNKAFDKEFADIKKRISYIDTFSNGETQYEISLRKELDSLQKTLTNSECLLLHIVRLQGEYGFCFSNPNPTNDSQDTSSIKGAGATVNDTTRSAADTSASNPKYCLDETCQCFGQVNNLKRVITIYAELNNFQEKRALINDLLCDVPDSIKNTFFSINATSNSIRFMQEGYSILPKEIKFRYEYAVGDKMFTQPKNNVHSVKINVGHKFQADINRTDVFKEFLLEWHNEAVNSLNVNYLKRLQSDLKNDNPKFYNYQQQILNCPDGCDAQALKNILDDVKRYDTVWCSTSSVAAYLRKWLWYSGGEFKFNYLGIATPDNIKGIAAYKKSATIEKKLEELNKKIESLKSCLSCNIKSLDTLQWLQDSARLLTEKVEAHAALKKSVEEKVKSYESFVNAKRIIHSINLPAQTIRDKKEVIYHNVEEDFEAVKNRKWVLPDDRSVFLGFMNVKKDEKSLKIEQKQETFNDSSVFVRELRDAFSNLAAATSPLVQYYLPFTQFATGLFGSFDINDGQQQLHGERGPGESDCSFLKRQISSRLWRITLLDSMLTEYERLPTPNKLKAQTNEKVELLTYAVKAEEWQPPYSNKYTVKYEDKLVVSNRFSMGRQRNFSLGSGIFFNENSARQINVDTAGNAFKITNTDSKSKFVIGIKVFPFKNFEADGALIPRYPLKRFNLFGGFEITRPLENLYAGVGYDLVPGLQVSYGVHFYRRDVYTIQNNQIIDKTTSYKDSGPYYGVTIDPVVLAGILKSFFSK